MDGGPGRPVGGRALSPHALEEAYGRSSRVVGRRIGDEYVLIPLVGQGADLDGIRSLNPVGVFIWEQLDGTRTGAEMVDAIVARFEVDRPQAAADYLDFLKELRRLEAVQSAREDEGLGPHVPEGGGSSRLSTGRRR